MNVEIPFQTAPPTHRWAEMLAASGWKLIDRDTNRLRATRQLGQSEYPVRNAITWYVEIEAVESGDTRVRVSVPAFAESLTANERLLSMVDSLSERVDGPCETDRSLSVDLLSTLRS